MEVERGIIEFGDLMIDNASVEKVLGAAAGIALVCTVGALAYGTFKLVNKERLEISPWKLKFKGK